MVCAYPLVGLLNFLNIYLINKMKKFFSLIALVGVFAACQPETISTTFEPKDAQVTIQMTAVDLATGEDVTAQTQFSSTAGTVSGSTITITGNPDIPATNFTVTAKYGNGAYQDTFKIPALAAGGEATYQFGMVVGDVKPSNAIALISVSAWDVRSQKEVTSEVKIESKVGSVSENIVYIEGNPTITSQNVEIKVIPTDCNPVTTFVKINDQAAGELQNYAVRVEVGEDKPVVDSALAVVNVKVINKADEKNVTKDAAVKTSVGEYEDGKIVIKGNPEIDSQEITISANYKEYEEASEKLIVNAVAAGDIAYYDVTIVVGKEVSYTLQYVKGETVINEAQHYTFTTATHEGHATVGHDIHAFSHDGHSPSSWMLNDTEMILKLYTTYEANYGNQISGSRIVDATLDETALITAYEEAIAQPKVSFEEKKYEFQVSAWAYYNAVQTVITSETKYTINRIGTDESKTELGFFILKNWASSIEAVEYAANTHYVYSHGHGHSTHDEHGNSNAGGGICYAD